MCRLYPVFNVVKLTPAPHDPIAGRHPKPPPPPELIEGEEEYLVEEILDSKMFRRRLRFLVKWEGYSTEHNTWEYATDVHAPKCLAEFYWKYPLHHVKSEPPFFRPSLSSLYPPASSRSSPKRGGGCKGTPLTLPHTLRLPHFSLLPQLFRSALD